jgi:enterobactin synthetase component D
MPFDAPNVLPEFVTYCSHSSSKRIPEFLGEDWEDELPPQLRHAVTKRKREFIIGRYCAYRAIRQIRSDFDWRMQISKGPSGAPVWPDGIVGSITHTEGYVAAAVASRRNVDAIGIDSERVLSVEVAREVSRLIASQGELDRIERTTALDAHKTLSLCFSAKESLFKCLHPLINQYFDYLDAEIVDVQTRPGRFGVRLGLPLSEYLPSGTVLFGCFEFSECWVHTGLTFRRPN